MKKYIFTLFIYFPCASFAQLYTDASLGLPDFGAKGASMDVQGADLDNDGDMDIILANEFQANTILINNGEGVFTNGTLNNLPQEIHDSEDVVVADFNNDGNLDLVFCSEDDVVLGGSNVHEYYLGDGSGKFTPSTFQLQDSEANAVISLDVNADGFMDLIFGNNGANGLLLNDGNGSFTNSNDRIPINNKTTQDLALADIDGDGDMDIFEGNENGNVLLLNDGDGFFSDVSDSHLPVGLNIETRKVSFGDVDADGDMDVFLSNVEFIPGKDRQNRLFLNDGEGTFSDATNTNLPIDNDYTLDAIFEDIDFDMDLDIIICNFGGAPIKIYENDGQGVFTDKTISLLGQLYTRDALGVFVSDYNGDGLNDIYICDRKSPNTNNKDLLLIRNPVINSNKNMGSENQEITVMPNPGNSIFTVQMKNEIPDKILITDIKGALLQSIKSIPNDTMSIDLSILPRGTYLLVAHYSDNQQLVKKIVKE